MKTYKIIEIVADDGASDIKHCDDYAGHAMTIKEWRKAMVAEYGTCAKKYIIKKH